MRRFFSLVAASCLAAHLSAKEIPPYVPAPHDFQPAQTIEPGEVLIPNGDESICPAQLTTERTLNGTWKFSGVISAEKSFPADVDLASGFMNPEFDDFHPGLSGVSGLSVIPCGFASISSYPVYDTSKPDQEPVYIKTGSFDSAYEFAAFWTANTTSDNTAAGTTEDSGVKPYYRYIHKSDNKLQINTASDTSFGAPIRCVKAVGNGQTE